MFSLCSLTHTHTHVLRSFFRSCSRTAGPPPPPYTPRSFYYDCLMKPNAKSVTTALRKVKDLPYTMIANGHGPILR